MSGGRPVAMEATEATEFSRDRAAIPTLASVDDWAGDIGASITFK